MNMEKTLPLSGAWSASQRRLSKSSMKMDCGLLKNKKPWAKPPASEAEESDKEPNLQIILRSVVWVAALMESIINNGTMRQEVTGSNFK